ncbi:MAG: ABC transporter ATP-binding protein [Actinomycetota bacterium]|nr:ABC transporter ATP-binding protein [Actinomycetota bacterium]
MSHLRSEIGSKLMLTVDSLCKSYGDRVALSDVSFRAAGGEILAVLGRNGAGKTTLVSIVAGLRRADSGQVRIAGVDPAEDPHRARGMLGLAPQETGVYPTITCRQNLRFFARLAGCTRRETEAVIDETAAALDLIGLLDRRAQELSGGERRRLHTALALVGRPSLVLLDEPTVGADVQTRMLLLDFVKSLAAAGTTVVYSTHYLAEIEELDASIVVLAAGRVVANGAVAEIVTTHAVGSVDLMFNGPAPDLPRVAGELSRSCTGPRLQIRTHHTAMVTAAVVGQLGGHAPDLRELTVTQPDLESAFLNMTRGAPDEQMAEKTDVA